MYTRVVYIVELMWRHGCQRSIWHDFDLEHSNLKLSHNTLVQDHACNFNYIKFGGKRFRTSGGYFTEDLSPHCDLDLEDSNPNFLHDTQGHNDAPSYQVWLHTVQWFGRYLPDKGVIDGQMDRRTEGRMDRRTT